VVLFFEDEISFLVDTCLTVHFPSLKRRPLVSFFFLSEEFFPVCVTGSSRSYSSSQFLLF